MAKPEWGIKRLCASCGARFYDLKKDPIICPKCEEVFDPEAVTRLKRSRSSQTALRSPESTSLWEKILPRLSSLPAKPSIFAYKTFGLYGSKNLRKNK